MILTSIPIDVHHRTKSWLSHNSHDSQKPDTLNREQNGQTHMRTRDVQSDALKNTRNAMAVTISDEVQSDKIFFLRYEGFSI